LGGTFARPVRFDSIEQQYDEIVKSTVALKRGTATAEAILKRYNSYNLTHPTYKALAEVGKAEKSIFFCDYLSSRETQHEVHEGLNVVENWNATNDFICFGRQGELATNSREQQEIVTLSPSPQSFGFRNASSLLTTAALALRRVSGEKYVLRTYAARRSCIGR
jgi:TnpA family transposase